MRPLKNMAEIAITSLQHQVNLGRLPKVFAESDDPNRLMPIVFAPKSWEERIKP